MRTNARKRITELKLPARASFFYLASGVTVKGLGFLATLLFTRMLSPAEYGEAAVYMSWIGIGETCAAAFISSNVIYKGLSNCGQEKGRFISNVLGSFLLFSPILCTLLFTFSLFFGFNPLLIPFGTMQIISDGITSVKLLEKKHCYSYLSVTLSSVSEMAASIVTSFILIAYARIGFLGKILGLLIPSAAIALFYLIRNGGVRLEKRIFLSLSAKALPLLPGNALLAFSAQCDRLIINAVIGADAAARYSVVHSVGVIGVFFVSALSSSLHPWLGRKLSQGQREEVVSINYTLLSLFSSLSPILVAVGPLAMRFLAPREYGTALAALIPLSLSIIPYFGASINSAGLIFLEMNKEVSKIAILSGVLGLLTSFLLIPLLGYVGAGLSVLILYCCSYFLGEIQLAVRKQESFFPKGAVLRRLLFSAVTSIGIYYSAALSFLVPLLLIPPALTITASLLNAGKLVFE